MSGPGTTIEPRLVRGKMSRITRCGSEEAVDGWLSQVGWLRAYPCREESHAGVFLCYLPTAVS